MAILLADRSYESCNELNMTGRLKLVKEIVRENFSRPSGPEAEA
jgi:hypothetical protein